MVLSKNNFPFILPLAGLVLAALSCSCTRAGAQGFSTLGLSDEWRAYDSVAMRITVHYPSAWEIVYFGPENFDIEETDGDGWLETYMLDTETPDYLGISFDAEADGEDILALIRANFQEMLFGEVESLGARAGEATATRAYDIEHDEYVYAVALVLPDRSLMCLGWGYEETIWEENYIPIYQEIIQSIDELR